MATATKTSATPEQFARGARDTSAAEPLEFVIFEDNRGDFHWRIDAGDGATLAQSNSYASSEDAGRDMQRVRVGAASARFERGPGKVRPLDLAARREAGIDDSDAARWLDEGGSSSEAATA
jgi:uncharacterized protein YegP (UPF0339 family)